MRRIDLNADLGEGGSADADLMALVSSCNIACGGHAGDSATMRSTLALAKEHGVSAGAHPSYPDREGFGRRSKFMEGAHLERSLFEQVQELEGLASEAGLTLNHLKPHGALYHDANEDSELATAVVTVAGKFGLKLVGPPDGSLRAASADAGVTYIAEGFADRAYDAQGRLVARGQPGAVFDRPEQSVQQALSMAQQRRACALDGTEISLPVDTLCLHGDTPGALKLAVAVRSALLKQGVDIRAPSR